MIFAIINSYVQFAQAFNCQVQTLKVLNVEHKDFTTCEKVINIYGCNSIRHFVTKTKQIMRTSQMKNKSVYC